MEHFDLLITSDGIALDSFGLPLFVSGRESIAQDIKHMIRESGLLVQMLGERNGERIRMYMVRIEELTENDLRIRPGTASLVRNAVNSFTLSAETMEYGSIEVQL